MYLRLGAALAASACDTAGSLRDLHTTTLMGSRYERYIRCMIEVPTMKRLFLSRVLGSELRIAEANKLRTVVKVGGLEPF